MGVSEPMDFADKVLWMRDHPEELARFRTNARRLAEDKFSREILANRLETILLRAAAPSSVAAPVPVGSVEERNEIR